MRHRLTSQGRELLRAGNRIVNEELATSFAPLSDEEVRTLHTLLNRLLNP